MVDPRRGRSCLQCQASLEGMRSHAKYCSRSCKGKAASRRRVESGAAQAADRARYAREAEHRRAYAREQYWSDPERSREYSRAYRATNPDVRLAQHHVRKARKLGNDSRKVSASDLQYIKSRQRDCCYYCGISCDLVIDHVVPLAKGGRHAIGNLVGACQHCNSQKCAMLLIEWKRFLLRKGVSLTL